MYCKEEFAILIQDSASYNQRQLEGKFSSTPNIIYFVFSLKKKKKSTLNCQWNKKIYSTHTINAYLQCQQPFAIVYTLKWMVFILHFFFFPPALELQLDSSNTSLD